MTTYLIIRDGEIKLRLPDAYIADGLVCVETDRGQAYVVDSQLAARDGVLEAIRQLQRSEPSAVAVKYPTYCAGVGVTASGLEVIDEAAWLERQRAATPVEERELHEILRLRERGEAINARWDDEADTGRGYAMIREAEQRLARWRERYPLAAARHDAAALRSDAAELRSKALGALVYDADGWLDAREQQLRHDEYVSQARALEAQADDLLATS